MATRWSGRGGSQARLVVSERAARDFVFSRLMSARTIAIKTQRTDLHGRYVTHLFYSDTEISIDVRFRDGTYLNAELVNEGHAKAVA